MKNINIIKPLDIEKKSFEIISKNLKEMDLHFDYEKEDIIKRVIHTSADFDYAKNMVFSENAVSNAIDAIKKGAHIVTDTNMAYSGINKSIIREMGGEVHCFISDSDVALEAKKRGITRAMVSMEKACNIEFDTIFAIGNSPTALIHLYNLIVENKIKSIPKLIIAVPVGFVNVVEAKELIINSNIPHISSRGRKGGSNIAAAICNAIIYKIKR